MVKNSELQIWQDAVNGINVSGITDLSQEEWSALTTLNSSLSSGNFQSDESRHSIKLLKDNLSRHANNRILQTHLQNFINLCNQYFHTGAESDPVPAAGNTNHQPVNTNGNVPKGSHKGSGIMRIVIVIAVVLLAGYAFTQNSEWFKGFFSGRQNTNDYYTTGLTDTSNDGGVVINGIEWASRNVDIPGVFADKPESDGKFYQWNRIKAWETTGLITEWEKENILISGNWNNVNDPCPPGWRVPEYSELQTLVNTEKVTQKWIQISGINGTRFTDKINGNSIFMPSVGRRYLGDGFLEEERGEAGYYWSASMSGFGQLTAIAVTIFENGTYPIEDFPRGLFSVRCVKE